MANPAEDFSKLSTDLSSIEDWLRDHCTARHAVDMADAVHKAWLIVDGLADQMAQFYPLEGPVDG